MKLTRNILFIMLLSLLLTGCWGSKEIEHMIYVNSIGADYVNNKAVLYVQVINFSGIAKQESAQPKVQKTYVGKAEGDSFEEALFKLYATSQQSIAWSHVKTIVFSEAALQHGLVNEVLDVWDRYYEFRYTVWTMATKDSIEKVFNTKSTSELSVLYSQLNSPLQPYSQSSIIAPLYLYEFIRRWNDAGQTVLLPYLKIAPGWTEDNKPSPKLKPDGICMLKNKQFKGCLDHRYLLGLRWLEKKTERTPLEIKRDNSVLAMFVMTKIRSSIKPQVTDGKASFNIKISMQGTLPQLNSRLKQKKLEELAAQQVKKQIMGTYLKGLEIGVDLLGLSDKVYREIPDEWKKLEEGGNLPLDKNSITAIDVNVKLMSGGIAKIKQH
ncbi:Ger(x)C family spore germination protein [Neobacillus massiliamazoniensis]|uniref:Spore germination protein XC n=1 Tax=Neobacillus massiliamazoniensis TaxID=1499688 RepID=A0A0U1P413_9BACI|nr:Ger(x)C family spore germination protein [Neobacillus massiliamazoniensis]CRK84980.1 spore germination protein XC [Neobacillus massiliamazoniensis]